MASSDTVHLCPYVASAIIEHAKRRRNATGYLLGTRTKQQILVLDYIPMTHVESLREVTSKTYITERARRVQAKRAFTKHNLIGWYSAGSCPQNKKESQFNTWCELPSFSFAGQTARQAIYVHCAMPGIKSPAMKIEWQGYLTSNKLDSNAEKGNKYFTPCQRVKPLQVLISGMPDVASNVILNHVLANTFLTSANSDKTAQLTHHTHVNSETSNASNQMMNGILDSIEPQIQLLNLDRVAASSACLGQNVSEVLNSIQSKVHTTIDQARDVVKRKSGSEAQIAAATQIVQCADAIAQMKANEAEQQIINPSAREDFITQRFKDALMTKLVVVLLRKELAQIETLASAYPDERQRQNQGNARYPYQRNRYNANSNQHQQNQQQNHQQQYQQQQQQQV